VLVTNGRFDVAWFSYICVDENPRKVAGTQGGVYDARVSCVLSELAGHVADMSWHPVAVLYGSFTGC